MAKIPNYLIEAYKGTNEDNYSRQYDAFILDPANIGENGKFVTRDEYAYYLATVAIVGDSPKERLNVYCHWNGIFGYSAILYDIAIDHLSKI